MAVVGGTVHQLRSKGRKGEPQLKNRIAIIAPHFPEYSLLLSIALSEHSPTALFIETRRLEAEYVGRERPSSSALTTYDVKFSSFYSFFSISYHLLRFKPSIIHIQEASGFVKAVLCALIVTVARPLAEIALTVHDPVPHTGRDQSIVRRLSWLRSYVRRSANIVFVHGQHCRQQYTSQGVKTRQRVVETAHGIILAGARKSKPKPPFRILAFGRMEAYKGIDVLCSAAEILRLSGTEFRLEIAGSGPELDRVESRLKKISGVTVRNAFIPAAELIELIQDSDCVVLPYLSATQSGVLAAAFANGRYVVASRVGGIPDLVKNMVNGILVPPNDPQALADALRLGAVDKALREKLSVGAAYTATEALSWRNIARATVRAYAGLASD